MMRYIRQENDSFRQQNLEDANILVIGAGGVGSAVLLYLATAGVGKIIVSDSDEVSYSNLPRQILYKERNLGVNKAQIACTNLLDYNSTNCFLPCPALTTAEDYDKLFANSYYKIGMIIDCSDNSACMVLSNEQAYQRGLPYLAGSAEGLTGSIQYFAYQDANFCQQYGCLKCLGYQASTKKISNSFILGPVAGTIGCMLALKAIKILNGIQPANYGKIEYWQDGQLQTFTLCADPKCQCQQQNAQVEK